MITDTKLTVTAAAALVKFSRSSKAGHGIAAPNLGGHIIRASMTSPKIAPFASRCLRSYISKFLISYKKQMAQSENRIGTLLASRCFERHKARRKLTKSLRLGCEEGVKTIDEYPNLQ